MSSVPPLCFLLEVILMLGSGAASAQNGVCPGASLALDTSIQDAPFVSIRLGARQGNFLVDTGATASSVDARAFGLAPGSNATIEGSSFPTVTGGTFAVLDWSHVLGPPGGVSGVIGTDFLSLRVVEFHYDVREPFLAVSAAHCAAGHFEAAGFTAVSQEGYYSADPRRLSVGSPNIPVMFIRIGTVIAPAQIDSGFNELGSVRGVVQINEALLRDLQNAGVAMSLDPAVALSVTDCHGRRFAPQIWRVQESPLQMTTREGETLFAYEPPLLEVKSTSTDCGGIATSPSAMGQIGAVYLERWGSLVLDPFNEQVWVKKAGDLK
jgi:hypothetical protein